MVYVTNKTRIVRARMTEDTVRMIEALAKQRGVNSSELLRRLVEGAMERQEHQTVAARYSYLHGKLAEALHMLVMDDTDKTLGKAFVWVRLGAPMSEHFPSDEIKKWYGELSDLATPSADDQAHPDAHERGPAWIHAERMSADDRARFKQALLNVTTALQFHDRWS